MKFVASLALALATALPAMAEKEMDGYGLRHVPWPPGPVITILPVDPHILYPIPKKVIPIPRPGCLSCPPDVFVPGMPGVIVPILR